MLQHTITFQTILCFQLCGNSLGKALDSFSIPRCTKRGPYRNSLLRSVWKNLTGLHRAQTSTPLNTFEMNWNADCEPCLIAQHQCPTSLMPLWLNGNNNPVSLLGFPTCSSGAWIKSQGKPSQKKKPYYNLCVVIIALFAL